MVLAARWGVLGGILAAGAGAVAWVGPIGQDPAYHDLADGRSLWGVPNALNVLSNAPFLLVGAAGMGWVLGQGRGSLRFVDPRERWPYLAFFGGLALTGLGSVWYHLAPDNAHLVWDRLPLAATLMALLAAVLAERVGVGIGLAALGPLLAIGAGSVLVWALGEQAGQGDLRLYAVVQFYPMLAVPLLCWFWEPRYTAGGGWGAALGSYALAKGFEATDRAIFALGGMVSGHTLKHLAAALAGWWILRMLMRREARGRG